VFFNPGKLPRWTDPSFGIFTEPNAAQLASISGVIQLNPQSADCRKAGLRLQTRSQQTHFVTGARSNVEDHRGDPRGLSPGAAERANAVTFLFIRDRPARLT